MRSAARLISSYRTRSPIGRRRSPSPSTSPLPTPHQNKASRSSRNHKPPTPSRSYHVYNDGLSPETQPQTPAHLPESRHQSRFHPSYTAPVAAPARSGFHLIRSGDGANDEISSSRSRHGSVTPSRRGPVGRSNSPIGLLNEGFRGLYGGRENGDEQRNWTDGVRFNNAEMRLWGLRDARGDGRSLRETPEREIWRVRRD